MKPSKPRVNARKFGDRNGGVFRGKAMPYFELRRGGAKGFYTIGVLKGLEGLLGAPLHKHFDLVYGTSTGSIIAALICLGKPIDEIHTLYKDHVVKVMGKWFPWTKSRALRVLAAEIFANTDFKSLQTDRWTFETPMIFKTSVDQAFTDHGNFVPGLDARLATRYRLHVRLIRSFSESRS